MTKIVKLSSHQTFKTPLHFPSSTYGKCKVYENHCPHAWPENNLQIYLVTVKETDVETSAWLGIYGIANSGSRTSLGSSKHDLKQNAWQRLGLRAKVYNLSYFEIIFLNMEKWPTMKTKRLNGGYEVLHWYIYHTMIQTKSSREHA